MSNDGEPISSAVYAALDCRRRAYAPYSGFAVGAAVVAADGRIYAGANVENASYGLTICAERVALFTAISAGATGLHLLVVVADTPAPVSPCGACRQVLAELAPEARVLMVTTAGARREATLNTLLPERFTAHDLPASRPERSGG